MKIRKQRGTVKKLQNLEHLNYKQTFFSPLMYNHTTSSQLYCKYLQIYKGYMISKPNQQKQLN